jgi:hypothetical protein
VKKVETHSKSEVDFISRCATVIRSSAFFEEKYYIERNKDVEESGIEAALHYLLHGGFEGRDPGPLFSSDAYLRNYPDVASAKFNPLLHFELHGRREGRKATASDGKSRGGAAPPENLEGRSA